MASVSVRNITMKDPKGGSPRIDDVTFDVDDGEFVVLIGPKKSGKTALLRSIAGLERDFTGEIYINNHRVTELSPKDRKIGMVFQQDGLFPSMTVYENIAFCMRMAKLHKDLIEKRVQELAERFRLTEYLKSKPAALNPVIRQRVSLARAIAIRPDVLLIDDPLTALDETSARELSLDIVRMQAETKLTVIFVTSNKLDGLRFASRVAIMSRGKLVQYDVPQSMYDFPVNLEVARFFGVPALNEIPAELQRVNDNLYLCMADYRFRIPAGKAARVRNSGVEKRNVIFGIRAENIHDDPAFLTISDDTVFEAKVILVEMLGMMTYLHLSVKGIESIIVAIVEARSTAQVGETIQLAFDFNHMHLFDTETGSSLLLRYLRQ